MHPTAAQLARNVYEILSKLPRHGVGSKLSRKTWMENSFWKITDVKMETSGKGGKAYGILTWRGEQAAEKPVRINGSYKKVWRQLDKATPLSSASAQGGWPSLALAALKQESAAAAASTADTEPSSEATGESEDGSSSKAEI